MKPKKEKRKRKQNETEKGGVKGEHWFPLKEGSKGIEIVTWFPLKIQQNPFFRIIIYTTL